MKTLTTFFVISVGILFIGCGTKTEKTDLRENYDLLGVEEAGIEIDSMDAAESDSFVIDDSGFQLKGQTSPVADQELVKFLKQGVEELEDLYNARRAVLVAISVSQRTSAGFYRCLFMRSRGVNQNGEKFDDVYRPEGQSPICLQSFKGRRGNTTVGGSTIATAVKLSTGTYAGAIGIGAAMISGDYLAGCAAGASGIVSSEFAYSAGSIGAVCGAIDTSKESQAQSL